MRLSEFNALPPGEAMGVLSAVCAAPGWGRRLVAGRPYGSVGALTERADQALAELDETEIDHALADHPRIGERSAHPSSRREQAGVADAEPGVLAALATGNRSYEDRFGQVYLVCADGRPAAELLAVLRGRLDNDPATERRVLRDELAKINRLRLARLLGSPSNTAPCRRPGPPPAPTSVGEEAP